MIRTDTEPDISTLRFHFSLFISQLCERTLAKNILKVGPVEKKKKKNT